MTRRVEIPGIERLPDGRYRIRGRAKDPKTGNRIEIDRIVEATSEVHAASIRDFELGQRLASRGAGKEPERERLGPALASWLAAKKSSTRKIRQSTASTYSTAVERWTAALGDYYVDKITPEDVEAVMDGWRDEGLRTDTINGRLRVLRTFAKSTKNAGIVEGVKIFGRTLEEEEDEDEGRGLDRDELRLLLAAGPRAVLRVKDKAGRLRKKMPPWWFRAWALVATMAWTGLRFGEASALEWHDLDLAAGTLWVRRAQWRGILGHVKAKASRRRIALAPDLVAILREHRAQMLCEQHRGVDSPLMFPSRVKDKTYVTNTYARKTMLTIVEASGLDLGNRPALHCLRHTMNNLVRQHATEEVRRSLIGHADEVETYTHVSLEEQEKTVRAVVRYLTPEGP